MLFTSTELSGVVIVDIAGITDDRGIFPYILRGMNSPQSVCRRFSPSAASHSTEDAAPSAGCIGRVTLFPKGSWSVAPAAPS